jgi:two-component sensor histidine kinase
VDKFNKHEEEDALDKVIERVNEIEEIAIELVRRTDKCTTKIAEFRDALKSEKGN